jgi:hypothetical protein
MFLLNTPPLSVNIIYYDEGFNLLVFETAVVEPGIPLLPAIGLAGAVLSNL